MMQLKSRTIKLRRKWKGFRRYLYKIILSNILLVLIPICILGIFWYIMMTNQAEQKFHQQKSIEMNEIVSGIKQRIKTIKLDLAAEQKDRIYASYTRSKEYTTDLWLIANRLYTMKEKYSHLHSVYFYDRTTGKIYTSISGSYSFDSFHDTKWLEESEDIYSVQQLPLRYAINNDVSENNVLYPEYNKLVLSLVIKGKPDYYLVANINVNGLFMDVYYAYDLNEKDEEEFFFLDSTNNLIEGHCKYIQPKTLMQKKTVPTESGVSYVRNKDRIYFIRRLDFGIVCVTSYPIKESYQEAGYLGKYILLVCFGLMLFLLVISAYMAKRLYRPINTLYSEIATSARNLNKEDVSDEIEMLKEVFTEMNTFNTNAAINLKQFDEINKAFNFRNFLEHSCGYRDFLTDHPYLFDQDGNGLCELLVIKLDLSDMGMTVDEELLFRLNLQEVLRTYLQSSMKGILTKVEEDNLALLYLGNERESLDQTRKVLTDTVTKLTDRNTFYAVSNPILQAGEILPQFQKCLNIIENSYFFHWKNEIITVDESEKQADNEDFFQDLPNRNASLIRAIVSQNEAEAYHLIEQLEQSLYKLKNSSKAKDICNRIMVDLDNEFHLTKTLDISLIKELNESKTLTDMMCLIKKLLKQVSLKYRKNDARENHYCEAAKKYLDEKYMRDMNITDVADHLEISYSYLSRIFRVRSGITLTDYLNNIRIEKSKEYLAGTYLTLSEISEKVGYNNVQSYQRFFKKYANITPGDYRRLHGI